MSTWSDSILIDLHFTNIEIQNNCFPCRFLHPGVTDKGNYNMFEVLRGVMVVPTRESAPPESAWERGLRTAKEVYIHI